MKEETVVRNNLMNEKNYAPYCGNINCVKGMPRAKWNIAKRQFDCSCGWTSEFPADFIKRYRDKWKNK